jgi:hypothetical protein
VVSCLSLLVALAGCGDDGGGASTGYMDDIPPNGCDTEACPTSDTALGTGTTDTGSGEAGGGDACNASQDCPVGTVCAASFDGDNRGPFACVSACIEAMDEASWCADAGACCNPDAACTDRGYCLEPGSPGTGTSTGTGTGTSG